MRAVVPVLVALAVAGCFFDPPKEVVPTVVGILQVIVQDEQERPLAGATVRGNFLEESTTDRTGVAAVRGFAPGTSLSVHATGYEDVFVSQVSVPGSSPVRVVLKRRR